MEMENNKVRFAEENDIQNCAAALNRRMGLFTPQGGVPTQITKIDFRAAKKTPLQL